MNRLNTPAAPRSYSHFRRVNGLLRHARVYPNAGSGAAPIVIVPGLGCAAWMYRRLARRLAPEREVWVYDHPGMGFSRARLRDPVGIEQLTDDLAAWMRARGFVGVPVLGHSLGGEVVIDLAARYPDLPACLIMCAPTGIPENPSVTAQVIRFMRNMPRERLALYLPATAAYLRTGPRAYWLARDQDRHETGPLIPQVHCPALVIDGTADPVIRAWTLEVMCEILPRARASTILGGTHAIMDSRPQEVADETLRFLRDVASGQFTDEC
ncbi:alpha/beta fold hydrolase [Deinococcus altitudinis]|uniref:alpha/beta fold hydrolase n=1 Tax=Deinococcus altitudinis TaxID=468914 RepID=UPI0038920CA2